MKNTLKSGGLRNLRLSRGFAQRQVANEPVGIASSFGPGYAIPKILREGYEDGESIDYLAKDSGLSITRVRGLLKRAGAEVRPQGRPTKK